MDWSLYTFAGGKPYWRFAAARLLKQARASGIFSNLSVRDTAWLKASYPSVWRNATSPSGARGFGFWRWKPHLILEALQEASTRGEGVVYLDAGCEINLNGHSRRRFLDYFTLAQEDCPVAMKLDDSLDAWCKREVLQHFGISTTDSGETPVIEAGVLILAPTPRTLNLVKSWAEAADDLEGFLFNDELEPSSQLPNFRDHRHDQAVLSCLMHKEEMCGIPSETYFAPDWAADGRSFPIWALRNRFPFSIKPGTAGNALVNLASLARSPRAIRNL